MDSSPKANINQPAQPPQHSSKNTKNLSIKEFISNRLMRTKSFEGEPQQPRDETPSWFEEIKARVSKRSQGTSSSRQALSNEADELFDCDATEPSVNIGNTPRRTPEEENANRPVTFSCDNDSDSQSYDVTLESLSYIDSSPKITYSNVRARRSRPRVARERSFSEVVDFDTSSTNTILNRRDSRYDGARNVQPTHWRLILGRFVPFLAHFLAFNYNLPWKLLSLVNFSFVIILVGVTQRANPSIFVFSFTTGFVCGLVIAGLCAILACLSLLLYILPETERFESRPIHHRSTWIAKCSSLFSLRRNGENTAAEAELNLNTNAGGDPARGELHAAHENNVDDDDYRGWMIEFIGHYEHRNKTEVKLKLMLVRVENRILYLCKPKNSHDVENSTNPVFVQTRTYDLNVAQNFSANLLLPKSVKNRQKWVWSKKYPIRLEFMNLESEGKSQDVLKLVQLTLFAKSCREKEEWFRRFKRIVEDRKMARNLYPRRLSVQSSSTTGKDEQRAVAQKLSRPPSPGVQTSRSSHLLDSQERTSDDCGTTIKFQNGGLNRTRSCELLTVDQTDESKPLSQETSDDESNHYTDACDDEGTLTRETAQLFSRNIEYSNFIENQPTLNYKSYIENVIQTSQAATSTSDWFNSLTGRIFFDVFSQNYWSIWFKRKIQRKLHRIRLPYFMETLTLTKIDLGSNAPQFLNVVSHHFDSFGLSIDFDMSYEGGLTMTFETKLNFLKIKNENSTNASQSTLDSAPEPCKADAFQSSERTNLKETGSTSDSSSEERRDGHKLVFSSCASTRTSDSSSSSESESGSSSDSCGETDVDEISDWEDYGAEKTRQNIVKFVDKIASSRYFQQATENRYIKKKLQDISNCPLVLVVQIQSLNGVLTLNVPPPQTNRIWYGFKPNPELTLKALPKMGDREVNLTHVTDWIEKKLSDEFRKILVMPNMEDVVLPVLKSDHLSYISTTK